MITTRNSSKINEKAMAIFQTFVSDVTRNLSFIVEFAPRLKLDLNGAWYVLVEILYQSCHNSPLLTKQYVHIIQNMNVAYILGSDSDEVL